MTAMAMKMGAWAKIAALALAALWTIWAIGPATAQSPFETKSFAAADGVMVTGDWYKPNAAGARAAAKTVIISFHQANSSRGEYRTIAPKLADLGYGVLAIDQRSGRAFAGIDNATRAAARKLKKPTGYIDASADLRAAAAFARADLQAQKVIAIGSSYSAALTLVLAGREPGFVDAAAVFSPGEYLGRSNPVAQTAAGFAGPVFVASARSEAGTARPIAQSMAKAQHFVPKGAGAHGASILISGRSDAADETWQALTAFLADVG